MKRFHIRKNELVFIWMIIYITSKMLWDKIPMIFEMLFLVMNFWFAINFLQKYIIESKIDKLILGLAILWIYVLANAVVLDTKQQLMRALYEYVYYSFFAMSLFYIYSKVNVICSMKIISVWGIIISLLSWYEYLSKTYLLRDLSGYGNIGRAGQYGFRSAVFTRSFISHGVILGIFSLINIFLWYKLKKKRYIIFSIFAYASILTTGSRGPLVAFSGAILVLYIFDAFYVKKIPFKKIRVQFTLGLLFILLLVLFSVDFKMPDSTLSYFVFRIKNIVNWKGDAGNAGRLLIWNNAIHDWFASSPLVGIGASQTGSWGTGSLGVTESGVLKRLCELGIVGVVINYSIIGLVVINSIKTLKRNNNNNQYELLFWLGIFVGVFINDITVQSTEEIMVAFWYWGALGCMYYISKEDNKKLKNILEEQG